jgi:hypothetical protein
MKTYTKQERKLIHAALVAAKPFLATRRMEPNANAFLCWAIEDGVGRNESRGSHLAQQMIHERIKPDLVVTDWLLDRIGYSAWADATAEDFQEYRHRWLDAMIKEFSK